MEVSSENHLFLWAMASMAMSNNQRVLLEQCSKSLLVDDWFGDFTSQCFGDYNNPIGVLNTAHLF